jgi:HSP20 family molecular chaperone IbpA
MPDDADAAKIDATFKDGMLDVVIGKTKAKQANGKKEIPVHS